MLCRLEMRKLVYGACMMGWRGNLEACVGINVGACLIQNHRHISTELASALRPFYFAVHPDLFGKYPMQRSVNEDSLKQLSVLLENKHMTNERKILRFYIREAEATTRDTFKVIQLKLDGSTRDPKTIVLRLLELCNLPTEHVRQMKSSNVNKVPDAPFSESETTNANINMEYQFSNFTMKDFYQMKTNEKKNLNSWIKENAELARERANANADLREEVKKLQQAVSTRLSLREVRYDCGWNFEHFRGCLKTLERMANMHEKHMHVLKNRVVVFAPFTGISLEGHVMLFTGDVLNNWIDFLKNIPNHDAFLAKVPLYENTLSQVLRNIKIGRRKFMPKQQAREYASHLTMVTTTLGDYLTTNKFPKSWPASLSDYEIVIESEAGPLMVNPTGQLIAPAMCPGFMLIDFITTSLVIAKNRRQRYEEDKHIEKELVERCQRQLHLKSLTKEDSITPDKMIQTLRNILGYSQSDLQSFKDINLHITNYYSVLSDGIVCIPWDFMHR